MRHGQDWKFPTLLLTTITLYLAPLGMAQNRACETVKGNGASALATILDGPWRPDSAAPEYVRYPVAGSRLEVGVQFASPQDEMRGFELELMAKKSWDAPFGTICSSRVTNSGVFAAQVGSDSAYRQWQITLRIPPSSGSGTSRGTLRVTVSTSLRPADPPPLEFSRDDDVIDIRSAVGAQSELVCQTQPQIRYQAGPQRDHPFSLQHTLSIGIEDTEQPLNSEAKSFMALYAAKALGTWNAVCANCAASNLLLLRIGTEMYMNSFLGSALRQRFPLDALELTLMSLARTSTKNALTYIHLEPNDAAIGQLCSLATQTLDAGMQSVQKAFPCRQASPPAQVPADIVIRILPRPPDACASFVKNPSDVIACRSDRIIELNGGDFAFMAHASDRKLFGSGAAQADLLKVMTHEAGHWIGLTHLGGTSIMAEKSNSARCINDQTVDALLAPFKKETFTTKSALLR
jgi:hypothetical protein